MTDFKETYAAKHTINAYSVKVNRRLADIANYYSRTYPNTREQMYQWHKSHKTNPLKLTHSWLPICDQNFRTEFSKLGYGRCARSIFFSENNIEIHFDWRGDGYNIMNISPSFIDDPFETVINKLNQIIFETYDIDIPKIPVYVQPAEPTLPGSSIKINDETFINAGKRYGKIIWIKIIEEPIEALNTSDRDPERDKHFTWEELSRREEITIVALDE